MLAATRAVLTSAAVTALFVTFACGESSEAPSNSDASSARAGASGRDDAGGTGGTAVSGGGTAQGGSEGPEPTAGTSSAGTGQSGAGGGEDTGGGGSPGGEPLPPGLCRIEASCAEPVQNEAKTLCTFEVRDGAGAVVYADHAGIELRGNSSLRYPKKNYSVELWTEAGVDHAENLLRAGKEADWILDGSWLDRSFLRNDLAFELFREAGYYAPESRFCTLALNSEEQGVYRLVERIKRDDDRVALLADDGTGKSFVIRQDTQGNLEFPLGFQPSWKMVYPRQETATSAQLLGVQSWLDGLKAALTAPAASSATTGIFEYLDFDATVDWILLEELSKNLDAYNVSVHLTRNAGGRAKFVPWDLDLAFGQPAVAVDSSNAAPEGWIIKRTDFIVKLSAVPALRARLAPRWRALRAATLSTEHVVSELEQLHALLPRDALAANFAIWPIDDVDASIVDAEYSIYPVTSYDDELAQLRAWIEARLSWMDAHIDAYPR